ncbi:MAG: hypothetical protein U9Q69_02810, partial [Nanoarchaeota archaeon]|nr:hypothetical protein [Nanoarchaeota archaeon]
ILSISATFPILKLTLRPRFLFFLFITKNRIWAYLFLTGELGYISNNEETEKRSQEIITKIRANNPEIFIISSLRSANENCDKVKQVVMSEIENYSVEIYQNDDESSNEPMKKIYFLKRKEIL